MPPKPKFTKEEIVNAAFELVRENGIESLTARELGSKLGSSARPIFTVFESMEQVKKEVHSIVMQTFEDYVKKDVYEIPSFKYVGIRMVQFALEEPNLYKYLFLSENNGEPDFEKLLKERSPLTNVCVEFIIRDNGLDQQQALEMFRHVWIHTFAIGTLCATGMCRFSEKEIAKMMERDFCAMLMLIKSEK